MPSRSFAMENSKTRTNGSAHGRVNSPAENEAFGGIEEVRN